MESRAVAWLAFCLLGTGCRTDAQAIPKSQRATVSQMVGPTRIEITYHRPVARGRELFGALVPYGRVWSPSADTAAIFSTTTALDVAGAQLPAGRYSVWAIPGPDVWTVIFSSKVPVFHLRYRQNEDVLRVRIAPRAGEHMESLGFYLPMVDADSAMLNLHWGKTVVPMKIRSR